MGWSGGVFTGDFNWEDDAAAGIDIVPDRHTQQDDTFIAGINQTLNKAGQNAATGNLPMGTNRHTGVGNSTARDQYLATGQYQDGGPVYALDTGTADALAANLSPAITGYGTGGMTVRIVKSASANAGAATIALNLLTAQDIKMPDGTDPPAGALPANAIIEMTYNGTDFLVTGILAVPAASDTAPGIIEIATQTEMEAATDTERAVTPGRQQYHPAHCKAWVVSNNTGTVLGGYNVSSVDDDGVGDFGVNFTTPFSASNTFGFGAGAFESGALRLTGWFDARTTGSMDVRVVNGSNVNADPTGWSAQFWGDQ